MRKSMNIRSIATVSLSVTLSIVVNLLFMWQRKKPENNSGAVVANAFHLVDPEGRIRAKLDFSGGRPDLTMLDESGNKVITLGIGGYGEGVLVFNSTLPGYERYGVVTVGYLTGSDTDAKTDPLGAWGIGVRLTPTQSVAMGLAKTGRYIGASIPPN
jgi:hypothetical protein